MKDELITNPIDEYFEAVKKYDLRIKQWENRAEKYRRKLKEAEDKIAGLKAFRRLVPINWEEENQEFPSATNT